MWILRKELGQREELLCLLNKLRDTNLYHLSRDKKDKEKVYITVCINVYNKYILFWQESNGVCIPICGNPF